MFRRKFYKFFACASAFLLFSACQNQTSINASDETNLSNNVEKQVKLFPFYDETWYEADFWPGEYPNGLIILEPDVTISARTANNPNVNPSLECKMDFLGVYHPWNERRVKSHKLRFFSQTKILPLTAKTGFEYPYSTEVGGDLKSKRYMVADEISYLGYLSEGFGLIDIEGDAIEIPISILHESTDLDSRVDESHLWIETECDGRKAYILTSDLAGRKDIRVGSEGVSEYGLASDLSENEVSKLKQPEPLGDDFYVCYSNDRNTDELIWIKFTATGRAKQVKYSNQDQIVPLDFIETVVRQGGAYPTTISSYFERNGDVVTGKYTLTQSGNWEYVEYSGNDIPGVSAFTINRGPDTYRDTPCF